MDDSDFKRPESILLVIYTRQKETLLLKRRTPPANIWQSVTGSLKWGEQPAVAAVRELVEETGIRTQLTPCATGIVNRYEIVPEARYRYPAGISENTEYVFTLELERRCDIQFDPSEHSGYCWVSLGEAVERVWSWSNKEAIRAVQEAIPD